MNVNVPYVNHHMHRLFLFIAFVATWEQHLVYTIHKQTLLVTGDHVCGQAITQVLQRRHLTGYPNDIPTKYDRHYWLTLDTVVFFWFFFLVFLGFFFLSKSNWILSGTPTLWSIVQLAPVRMRTLVCTNWLPAFFAFRFSCVLRPF